MATTDIGRVTPIWRGFYSAAATYELNDIVIDTAGSVWWHKSEELTTGVIPEAGEIWDAVIDMSVFSALIQAAITTAQTALEAAQAAVSEVTADTERAVTAAQNAENSAEAASESAAGVGALAQAAEQAKNAAQTAASQAAESASSAGASATSAGSSAQTAEAAKTAAAGSASDAEAWATGGSSGTPSATNNAKYWSEQAEETAEDIEASSAQIAQNAADVAELKTQIIKLTGNTSYSFSPGYIATNGTNADIETVTPHNEYVHAVIPCEPGDVFYVDVYGGNAPRSWCFIDNNNSGFVLDVGGSGVVNALITAPTNSTHLIVNTNTVRNTGFVCKDKPIIDKVNTNSSNIADNTTAIGVNTTAIGINGTNIEKNKTNTETVTGNVIYTFTTGGYIATSGDTADIADIVSNGAYAYSVVDCEEGNVFSIKGAGSTTQRLYAFLGAENGGVRPILEKSSPTYETNGFEYITAPENAEKLVMNVKVANDYFLCKGKIINKVWDSIDETNSQLQAQTGYIRAVNENLNTFGKTDEYYVSAGSATLGELNYDNAAFATDYIKVYPGSVIKVDNCYLYGARGICAYYADKTVKTALASDSGTTNPVSVIITIPSDCEYIRITGKIASGICTCEYLSLVADGMDEIRMSYDLISNTATNGKYVSYTGRGLPDANDSCYTDFVRVRQWSHIIIDKVYLATNRAICVYGKNQEWLREIIHDSNVTKYEFDVDNDVYYVRATGAANVPPEIYQSTPNVKDTKEFFKASHILIPYAHRDSVCRKIVTYVDDDALSEDGMDLLKASCDNLGIKCSISAITKILETTPSRVTYLKALEAEGFHICNHSNDHSRWYSDSESGSMFTLAEVEEDLIKSMQVLNSLGFIDAAKFFVYPGSSQTRTGIERIIKKWCELGCTISDGNNRIENIPRTFLYRCHIDQSLHADVDYYKTQLENLTVENGNNWIIYYSHCKNYQTEGGDWRQTLFEDVMQNALDEGYTVMTLNEAWNYRKSMWMLQEAFGV